MQGCNEMNTTLDYIRIFLYTLLVVLFFFLFVAWNREHASSQPQPLTVQAGGSSVDIERVVPDMTREVSQPKESEASQQNESSKLSLVSPTVTQGQLITVTTDVFNIKIDTRGGDIVEAKLLKYPESLGSSLPYSLLTDDPKTRYIAESGLLSKIGPDTSKEQALYTSPHMEYVLGANQNDLVVKLNWEKEGIKVTKLFTFVRDSYEIKVGYEIENQSPKSWQGNLYTQLMRTNTPPVNHGGMVNLTTYFGAAISSPAKTFEKITFKAMQENSLDQVIQGGWAA